MSERAAFAPKERFSDPDSLGTIFVTDEGDLNVREAITSSDLYGPAGYLLTDDPAQIAALDRYEPVKRVAVSEAEQAAADAAPRAARGRAKSQNVDSAASSGEES